MRQLIAFLQKKFAAKSEGDLLIDQLQQTRLFSKLNRSELRLIERMVHPRKYEVNEIIYQSGDMGLGLFIVLKGAVCLTDPLLKEAAVIRSWDTFGELALADSSVVRTHEARAAESSQLAVLLRPDLKDLMGTYPKIANKIFASLCQILAESLGKTRERYHVENSVKEVIAIQKIKQVA